LFLNSNSSCFGDIWLKHIGVTTFTFQDHLTSSITWPFNSQQAITYWWSFGTKPLSLSLTVAEIFNGECYAIVDMTSNDL